MYRNIIVKFADLSLKGKNKKKFILQLLSNIEELLANYNIKINKYYDYLEIDLLDINNNHKMEILNILKQTPGISNVYLSIKTSHNEEEIFQKILNIIHENSLKDFKIEVIRYYKNFQYNSSQFKQRLGIKLSDDIKSLVNMKNPKNLIIIFIYKECCYISLNKHVSLKGLPIGSGGKALVMISGGIDSPVASYLLLKKGLELEFIHFYTPPHTPPQSLQKVRDILHELHKYTPKPLVLHIVNFSKINNEIMCSVKPDYRIIVMRRFFYLLAAECANIRKIKAIATGESLGQVASQTISSLIATEEVVKDKLFLYFRS